MSMSKRVSTPQAWFTPVSGEEGLTFVSAIIDGPGLAVVVRGYPSERSWCFRWGTFHGFVNTDEGVRLPWHYELGQNTDSWRVSGNTNKVANSTWIAELGDLLAHHYPGCQHYCIWTDDFLTEVISEQEPVVHEVLQ